MTTASISIHDGWIFESEKVQNSPHHIVEINDIFYIIYYPMFSAYWVSCVFCGYQGLGCPNIFNAQFVGMSHYNKTHRYAEASQ